MEITQKVLQRLKQLDLKFTKPPIIIGGCAMEFYGMRKAGMDIDIVICNEDYENLSSTYPEKRKDIFGDMGLVIEEFEIWRSITLLDYDFFLQGAVQDGNINVISLEKLLLTRVIAKEGKKYFKDMELIESYYHSNFQNQNYLEEAKTHLEAYKKAKKGIVFGGNYCSKKEKL